MMKKRLSKKIWYGSDVDNEGNPVLPPLAIDSDDLEGLHYGELYLHIADDKLSLWTRTLTDQVKQIGGSGSGDGELWQLRQTDAGEPYLFSPFDVAVQRGLTSFVDGGSLDLPSIYDGLPIDNQTLYWKEVTEQVGTDEEGNPIYETTKVLKAKGGGGGVADSVHWDNIEGKPNFDDYATQDNLKDYLPLSGGTMTGQINMPVGIGNAIKFGEESRLFASNGNFYISAETHLIFASGASGNNVPNNAVIDKTGRMFIAKNLVVGHAGFIEDSYKLNVAGDAYVNGELVVSGTIYPSMPSLFNIGGSSTRFACVYADSVDVGGVKISLLQDGVLLIDGNLAVTGGITSYVDGGDLDLPSIYDGLPIDGDTLYWVLDENGKKVMLKSKGGDEEGGGSVEFPLKWKGFSEGSWDGSVEKEIVIPSKLSELDSKDGLTLGGSLNMPSDYSQIQCGEKDILECYSGTDTYLHGENSLYLVAKGLYTLQDGKAYGILHEGNYRNYEYTAKWLNVVDTRNTTPKPSDIETFAVTAQFTNTDNPGDGWYSGLSIQGWTNDYKAWQLRSGAWGFASDHLYFRNGELETWNEWRRVITGDVNGVLDFNLELKGEEGGNIKFVYNSDSAITTNKPNDFASIRHALRFSWYGEAYEIGTIRGIAAHSDGFGITHQNNHLVWQVNREQMDVYEDLKVHGNIVVDTDNLSAIDVSHRSSSLWNFALTSFNPIMPDGSLEIIEFGKGQSAFNAGSIGFKYFGDSSPNNMMTISLFNSDEILNITGHRKVGINTTTPSYDLEVNGQVGVNGDLRLKGGLIQYNEEKGLFYLEGNLVVSGGITSYVDVGNLNLPSIYDGLPLDMDTLGWKEVTDASGAKSKVLSVIGGIDESILWSDIEGIPSWIESSKPSYSYSEISGTPDLTKYALKENIPSLSGYATQTWVGNQGYAKSSDIPNLDGYAKLTHLSDYLPLSGVLPSSEFTLQGDLRLQKGNGTSGRKLFFGDGYNAYLYESPNNFLNIYADSGVKIYDNTTNFKEYIEMTRSGITLSTTSSSYISMVGMGIKVNDGVITYNKSGRYFELDGNLLVTGGITAFADSGAGNQWILDASALSGVTSTNQYKVYSANVTTMLAKKVTSLETKLSAIKTAFNSLSSSSSASAIGSALKTLASNL